LHLHAITGFKSIPTGILPTRFTNLSLLHPYNLFIRQNNTTLQTKMPTATTVLTAFAGIIALISLGVYFFGIPPELKRKMERKALETMGENKASYIMKDQISKIPTSDQEEAKTLKKSLGNTIGGALQNPLGEKGGELADDLTRPFTGR